MGAYSMILKCVNLVLFESFTIKFLKQILYSFIMFTTLNFLCKTHRIIMHKLRVSDLTNDVLLLCSLKLFKVRGFQRLKA